MKQINIAIIGFGRHCKRIYYPLYNKYKSKYNLSLKLIIDIKSQEKEIKEYLSKNNTKTESIFFSDENSIKDFKLNRTNKKKLNDMILKFKIDSVIISSEPSSHKAYIEWALENDLKILLDKPITSKKNSCISTKKAKGIIKDYEQIEKLYSKKINKNKNILISCMSQRRYHPAMEKIMLEVSKVSQKTNCSISSMTVLHSDGQWRMPQEIIEEKYHGYNEGYGKCSHSGYHFFDMISWFLDQSYSSSKNKKPKTVKIYSNFVKPSDTLCQLNYEDYKNIFGEGFEENTLEKDFNSKTFKKMGEVDAFINFSFEDEKKNKLSSINLSLIHNGFSKRSWFIPKKDLYKGNGRIRHECFIIEQGPFQAIHYHSYQSDEIRNSRLSNKTKVGGELHSEILIFRNSELINGEPFEKIDFGKIKPNKLTGYSRGHQEEARGNCFVEFFEYLQGNIKREDLKSDLKQHKNGVILMAGSYISASKDFKGKNPVTKLKYD